MSCSRRPEDDYAAMSLPFGRIPERYVRGDRCWVACNEPLLIAIPDLYHLPFYTYETLGGTIGHTEGLARASFDDRRVMLDKIPIPVADLKVQLTENLAMHKELYEEALEGYCAQAQELMIAKIAAIKAGQVVRLRFSLTPPEDHSSDYERVLRMLKVTPAETLEFSEAQFAAYWDDDWGWMENWLVSNSKMSAKTLSYMEAKASGH